MCKEIFIFQMFQMFEPTDLSVFCKTDSWAEGNNINSKYDCIVGDTLWDFFLPECNHFRDCTSPADVGNNSTALNETGIETKIPPGE
jgi:hypothetical protein